MRSLAFLVALFSFAGAVAQTSTDISTPTNAVGTPIAPTPVEEKAKTGLKVSGVGRIRFEEQARTSNLTAERGFMSMRFRPNITWDTDSGAKIVIEPQLAKRFGQESYQLGQTGAGAPTATLTESSGNVLYPGDALAAHQAYVEVPIADLVRAKLGRMSLIYGDQIILGTSDWGTYGRTFDAVLFSLKRDALKLDLFQAKIVDFGNTTGGDRDLNGVYLTYTVGEALRLVDVYAMERVDFDSSTTAAADTGTDNRYQVYGVRFAGGFAGFGYTLEFAKGSGDSAFVGDGSNSEMWVLDMSTPEMGAHRFGVEVTSAGENWNDLYPSPHKFLGRTDVLGRRNLSSQAVYLRSGWSERWSTELWAYLFQRRATDRQVYGANGTSAFGSATSTAKDIGSELDLTVSYAPSKSLTWSAGACAFLPGAYLKDTLDQAGRETRDSHFAYLMLETKY